MEVNGPHCGNNTTAHAAIPIAAPSPPPCRRLPPPHPYPPFSLWGRVGVPLIYNISKQRTFKNVKRWLHKLHGHTKANTVVLLGVNKSDLHPTTLPS